MDEFEFDAREPFSPVKVLVVGSLMLIVGLCCITYPAYRLLSSGNDSGAGEVSGSAPPFACSGCKSTPWNAGDDPPARPVSSTPTGPSGETAAPGARAVSGNRAGNASSPATGTRPAATQAPATTTAAPATAAAAPAPSTSPPVTSPPTTSPPVTSPPDTSPPDTSPPDTSPPDTSPPVTSPPIEGTPPGQLPLPGLGRLADVLRDLLKGK